MGTGRGFKEAMTDPETTIGYFIYSGEEEFPLSKPVKALGLAEIYKIFA